MTIQGYVDQISNSGVTGWVINWNQPGTPVEVSVVVDGTEVARCTADIMRERLKVALGNGASGAHEFRHQFAPPLDSQRDHTVEIWARDPLTLLTNGRHMFFGQHYSKGGFEPILITSSGRSGTTMLMQEFATHPEIVVAATYPFEIKLTSYYAGALNVLSAPVFVQSKIEQEFAAFACRDQILGRNPWNRPDLLNLVGKHHASRLIGRTFPDRLRDLFRSTIEEYYAIIAEESGRSASTRLFAEKGVLHAPVRRSARAMFGKVKEIVMVRDPRDYICSAQQFWKHDLDAVIAALRSELPIIQNIHKESGEDTIFVRYEDLILDADATKKKLYEFLGCTTGAGEIRQAAVPDSHRTSRSAAESIGRFREELDSATLDRCIEHFRGFMDTFGYSV